MPELDIENDQPISPFGVNFVEKCDEGSPSAANTNTQSMSDDDTNAYKSRTDDYDT